MHVIHVIAGPYPAFRGSQVLVRLLAEGLAARGHCVDVVSYDTWLGERPGFHPGRVPLDVILVGKLWRRVRGGGVDVIHAHNYEAAAAALVVGRLTGVPVVFHGHSAMVEEMPLYARGVVGARVLARLGRVLDQTVPRAAAACIAVTEELACHLRAGGVRRVVSVAPVLPAAAARGEAGRDDTGDAAGATVCYAGNLDAYQNLSVLLDAFSRVRERIREATLVLVSHADARRAAGRLARGGVPPAVEIVYAASYEEVQARLERADVLVLPRSESTGYPMKLLNYMAAGKAIVVAAGSAKGVRDGETARVVPDCDVVGLARAITDLLENAPERRRLGRAARAVVADPCRFEQSLVAVERVYDEVCKR